METVALGVTFALGGVFFVLLSIEHHLNRAHIRTASQLLKLATCTEWACTTRAVRLFLSEEPGTFLDLLGLAPFPVVRAVYHAAIVKGYHSHAPFAASFAVLQQQYDAMCPSAE